MVFYRQISVGKAPSWQRLAADIATRPVTSRARRARGHTWSTVADVPQWLLSCLSRRTRGMSEQKWQCTRKTVREPRRRYSERVGLTTVFSERCYRSWNRKKKNGRWRETLLHQDRATFGAIPRRDKTYAVGQGNARKNCQYIASEYRSTIDNQNFVRRIERWRFVAVSEVIPAERDSRPRPIFLLSMTLPSVK